MTTPKHDLLETVRRKAKDRPSFVAYVLARYQEANRLSDEQLGDWLGCTAERLQAMSLCRRPVGTDPHFRVEVEQVAHFGGVDAGKLVQVLRAVESMEAFRNAPPAVSGTEPLRLAARKVDKQNSDPTNSGGK